MIFGSGGFEFDKEIFWRFFESEKSKKGDLEKFERVRVKVKDKG